MWSNIREYNDGNLFYICEIFSLDSVWNMQVSQILIDAVRFILVKSATSPKKSPAFKKLTSFLFGF